MDCLKTTTTSAEEESSRASSSGGRPSPPKRPAGRTKFQETRHPVFRGVRQRGRAGRWVCEVRVPGSRGDRLWVGTFDTAEAAARAHDAAMLALCGAAATLNFPDSAWLLDVAGNSASAPAAELLLPDVQRAATEAVSAFLRRHGGGNAPAVVPAAPQPTRNAAAASSGTSVGTAPTGSVLDNALELDVFSGMDAGSYYASLAQGLLIDPPPPTAVECLEEEDEDCDAGQVELWS